MASSTELFKHFCEICEKIQKTNKYSEKEPFLSKYIQKYKKIDEELLKDTNKKPSFYPVMRLLVPEFERERGPYGLKETALGKTLINALCITGAEANKLINFKAGSGKKGSDFADVVFWIIKRRSASSSKLTFDDINKYLDTLAALHAENKTARETERLLYTITKSSTSIEMKWIIRIILKDLKLGMGNNKILKAFHQDAPDLYDVCSNLSKVCEDLNDPNKRLHELEITVFTPFRPMLSQKCDKAILEKEAKDNRLFYIENKFDGERFQLHMRDHVFKYYSKNGYDYTNTYGDSYDSNGLVTPHLKEMFKNITSIILDGEMMGWNTKTKQFGSKGMRYDVKNLTTDTLHRPCFCVFDVLLYNDRILTNEPLKDRINIINDLIEDINGVIMKSRIIEANSKDDLLKELNNSVDKEDEGICFKDPDSIYKPNNRKAGWWKLKLEYFEGVMTELDVVIIGGCYGEGRRRGLVSSFLLAVAVSPEDPSATPTEFYSFAKVANGFTIEELDTLLEKLTPHFKAVEKNKKPEGIFWKKEKPDLWIEPRNSVILQIKASELAKSKEFQTEYTLRFPRCQKIRYDKPWYNCMTTTELKELTSSEKAVEKLNMRHITADDVEVVPKKRQKTNLFEIHVTTLGGNEVISNLFQNKEICIYTGNDKYSIQNLELMVLQNGGKVMKLAASNNFCTVVGDITTAVHILKKNNPKDIVKLDWLLKAIEHSKTELLEWTPDDMINMSKETREKLSINYDKYGDSYTETITKEKFKNIFERINEQKETLKVYPEEKMEFDELISFKNPLALFRLCYAYFDKPQSKTNEILRNIEYDFRFYGGNICDSIKDRTTHIIIHSSDAARLEEIQQLLQENEYENVKIVNENWIPDCILSGTKLLENMFNV